MALKLSLAIGHYDRHVPLLEGRIVTDDIELQVIEVSNSSDRHRRMLKDQEFDAAEVSFSSYLMARDRGMPVVAIPVFPRRLFSQGCMYINTDAGIQSPGDLRGKRVGLNSYQTTLSVLAKGDLQHEYGVPITDVIWLTAREELFPFEAPTGVVIEPISAGREIGELLEAGEISAMITPRMPLPMLRGHPKVRRLFPDVQQEEIAYFHRLGFYPIMHALAVREDVLRNSPWVAMILFQAFEEAKKVCYRWYEDPNWSHLGWGRLLFEEQRQIMGADPWPNGVARNRANVERFITYSHEQGLIKGRMSVDSLFFKSTLDT